MSLPRSRLSLPITLAVVMIVLLIALTIGWVLFTVFGAMANSSSAGVYWALLTMGSLCYAFLLAGVGLYLSLSIKAINLTRRQSNFVDAVTHELKSPIASLKLSLQTLNRRQLNPDEQAGFHRDMLEDVERLDRLINQVLDAGRLDAQIPAGGEEIVAFDALLRECAEMICMQYQVPSSVVRFDLEPCWIHSRRAELDIIFRNLLDNAVKYAAAQPEVDVSLRLMQSGLIIVQISDNGRGIPPKLRRKLFRRFIRLGLELEREKPGTGLGLYIARTLVKRLGGSISVSDRPSGDGALFEVKLPGGFCQRDDRPEPPAQLPASDSPPPESLPERPRDA
jgi:signal transduction histidine kinase